MQTNFAFVCSSVCYSIAPEYRHYGEYSFGDDSRGFSGSELYVVLQDKVVKTTNLWACSIQGSNQAKALLTKDQWQTENEHRHLPVRVFLGEAGFMTESEAENWSKQAEQRTKVLFEECKKKLENGVDLSQEESIVTRNYYQQKLGQKACHCPHPLEVQTVKKAGSNCGREFYACPKRKCKFFEWKNSENQKRGPSKIPIKPYSRRQ